MRHKNIRIEFVAKEELRYATVGDWFVERAGLRIQISDEVSEEEQFLVALHELVEWRLCASRGISQKMVDEFDFSFKGTGEAGDSDSSPYRREHRFAMLIEHLMAHELRQIGYGRVE